MGASWSCTASGVIHSDANSSYVTVYRTPSEVQAIRERQELSFEFVKSRLFYGVPIRSGRQARGLDDCVQIWIEPTPDLFEKARKSESSIENVIDSLLPTIWLSCTKQQS